nr:antistasin-like [Lytechinus pictus]
MDGCKFGLATNEFGCSICKCKQSTSICPVVTLENCPLLLVCHHGLATNARGCDLCKCKPDVRPFIPPEDSVFETSSSQYSTSYPSVRLVPEVTNCPPLRCDVNCSQTGFASDVLGCPICQCIQTGDCCQRLYNSGPDQQNGCLSCRCQERPGYCAPVKESCNQDCSNGLATNELGCEICKCRSISVDECPEKVTNVTCPLTCPFGLATNNVGCDICKCKVPGKVP